MQLRAVYAASAIAVLVGGGMVVRDGSAPSTASAFETLEMYGLGPMPPVDGGDSRARAEVAVDHVALVNAAAQLGGDEVADGDGLSENDRALVGDLTAVEWGGLTGGELPRPSTLLAEVDASDLVALDTVVEESLITLHPGVSEVHRIFGNRYEVVGSDGDATQLVTELAAVTGVTEAVEVGLQRPLVSDDEHLPAQWGLENTGAVVRDRTGVTGVDVGWIEASQHVDGSGVVVAVIDSGVEFSHPDLAGKSWTNDDEVCGNGRDDDGNGYVDDCAGWDFVNQDPSVDDPGVDDEHGTHVAGVVAAATGNQRGVASLAPGVEVMSLKVFQGGSAPDTRISAAIDYAVSNGADVINLSLGGPGSSWSQQAALERARDAGVLAVIAAGNDGTDNDARPIYPASYELDNIISVGSIAADGQVSRFSNTGARSVDVFAPGEQILSTLPGDRWGYLSGTSMAAPMVTAVAAVTGQSWGTTDAGTVRSLVLDAVEQDSAYSGRVATGGRVFAPYALSGTTHLGELRAQVGGALALRPGPVTLTVRPQLRGAVDAGASLQLLLGVVHEGDLHAVVDHPVSMQLGGTSVDGATGATGLLPVPDLDDATRAAFGAGTLDVDVSTDLPAGRYVLGVGSRTAEGLALRPVVALFDVTEPTADDPGTDDPDADDPGTEDDEDDEDDTPDSPDAPGGDTDGGTDGPGGSTGGTTGGGGTGGTTGGTGGTGGTTGGDGGTTGGSGTGGSGGTPGSGSGGTGGTGGDGATGDGGTGGTTGDGGGTGGTGGGDGADGNDAGGDAGVDAGGDAGDVDGDDEGVGDAVSCVSSNRRVRDGAEASAVRPGCGPQTGATWVTIVGDFDPTTNLYIDIGGVVHRPVVVAPWALGFLTQPGPVGTHDVIIVGGPEDVVHPDAFTYLEASGPGRQGGGGALPGGGGGGGTIRDGGRGGGGVGGGNGRGGDVGTPDVGGDTGGDAPIGDEPGDDTPGGGDEPGDGGDTPDVEDAPQLGLDDTETAGEPFEAENGLTLDVVTGGPLMALSPGSWDRQRCTTDPCGAFGVG